MGNIGSACGRSKNKPVDYLALACGAAERVERVINPDSRTSSLHLNQAQCRLLAEALSQAVQSAKQDVHGVDAAFVPLFDPAFRELCRVAGDCEKLVRDCCNPNWVPAALLLADRRQEFSLRVSELKWCAKAWRTVIQHGLQGGAWLKRFHKSSQMSVGDRSAGTSDETRRRLEVAFEEDLATLQANLQAKVAEMRGSWRELARYVLSRREMIGRTVLPRDGEHILSKYELPGVRKSIQQGSIVGTGGSAYVRRIRWFQEDFAAKVVSFIHVDVGKEVGAMMKISGHPRSVCFVGVSPACNYEMEDMYKMGYTSETAIVMELLPLNLHQLMEAQMIKGDGKKCVGCSPFPLHIFVDIMLQVAEGVEAMHRVQLYHRDINPNNVLVELVEEQALRDVGYVRVRLADYGETQERSRWFGNKSACPVDYWAPEIGSWFNGGSLIYPSKADTYSYAILCSHILLGDVPFGEMLRVNIRDQVVTGLRPQLPEALPSLLASLIQRCWASDPTKRPTFATICRELRYVKFLMTIGGEDQFRALDDVEEDELINAKIVKGLTWIDGRDVCIKHQIGSGGFGSVDECIWKGKRVAVKSLPWVKKEDVEKEAALLVRVQHPMHVVRLIGCSFNEEKEKGILVMELMEQDLYHLIRKSIRVGGSEKGGPFSLCEALEIMWKVATAMKHVRSCNVLHGDLKTTNILVNVRANTSCASETHYDVKLADFGLSKYKSGNANFTTRASEAQYWRAPETSEPGKNSWAGDVFSFGVVCYEIVSGKRPFEGMEGGEVWRKVRGGERPEIPEYCGRSMAELVNACWATDPKERPVFTEICSKLEALRSL